MKLQINFKAGNSESSTWNSIKSALISALKQEMKNQVIDIEINEDRVSNNDTSFNIIFFGDELPGMAPERTFCIFPSTKYFSKYLGERKFAGATTPKLILMGPKIIIGEGHTLEKMDMRLDIYQSPKLQSLNNYFKATVIENTSFAEFIIKYVLEYMKQHFSLNFDNKESIKNNKD